MAKSLVVVESPAKAKTINKYLGRDYKVIASMGHVRDLPKSKLGVDVDERLRADRTSHRQPQEGHQGAEGRRQGRRPTSTSRPTPTAKARRSAGTWPRSSARQEAKIHRLTFNEITKKAVLGGARASPEIDKQMVDAQRARRVLDRLVGYKISPLLWDKVRRGLSAGRVQSVALKLVCDREREIEAFVPEEYWNIFARLAGAVPPEFDAKLLKKAAARTSRSATRRQSKAVLADLEQRRRGSSSSVTTKERKRSAVRRSSRASCSRRRASRSRRR